MSILSKSEAVQHPQRVVWGMGIAVFLCYLSSDMYLPLLPLMVRQLHTDPQWMQFSVSIYLLGLALARLFLVSLSDQCGRRPVIVWGGIIIGLGSLIAAVSTGVGGLILGRFLMGVGAAGSIGMIAVVVSDFFSGSKLVRVLSAVSTTTYLAPALAPVIGTGMGVYVGWHSVFFLMLAYHTVLACLFYFLWPETHHTTTKTVSIRGFKQYCSVHFKDCLQSTHFTVMAAMGALLFAGYLGFLTASPFIFQGLFHYSMKMYTTLILCVVSGQIMARFLNVWLLSRYTVMLVVSRCIACMLAAVLVLVTQVFWHPHPMVILASSLVFVACVGMMLPVLSASAIDHKRSATGVASALFGSLQMIGAFLGSALVASLANHSLISISILWALVAVSIAAMVAYFKPFSRPIE